MVSVFDCKAFYAAINTCNFFELMKLSKSSSVIKLFDKSSQCRCGMCPNISRVVFCKMNGNVQEGQKKNRIIRPM